MVMSFADDIRKKVEADMERDRNIVVTVNDEFPISLFEFVTGKGNLEVLGNENMEKVRKLEVGETYTSSEIGVIERIF